MTRLRALCACRAPIPARSGAHPAWRCQRPRHTPWTPHTYGRHQWHTGDTWAMPRTDG